jgi:glycosyltransferase involved in cell wall biosynthesis
MAPISVIIPTYRNPTYLDLALKSAFEGQTHDNQIIVVVDGYPEESQAVLAKYPDVNVVEFETNRGQMVAHNTGVTLAENEWVLIVNDDNVFPKYWDERLDPIQRVKHTAWSPNQIEPAPSIFKSFLIKDFGRTPETFQYDAFISYEYQLTPPIDVFGRPWGTDGGTWPLFVTKTRFMMIGGFDISFPSPAVADHDLFLRLEMAGTSTGRFFDTHFYHFAGAATKRTPEQAHQHMLKEQQSHEHFMWKWGFASRFDHNNSHLPYGETIRGVDFDSGHKGMYEMRSEQTD